MDCAAAAAEAADARQQAASAQEQLADSGRQLVARESALGETRAAEAELRGQLERAQAAGAQRSDQEAAAAQVTYMTRVLG